ncbi:MAG: HAMP domain-containing sensor histidine kinase [Cyanobacteria bacterium P01_G01_bin.54]
MTATMFQATRRRLALWYVAVTAVLLLILATGIYFYVWNTLIDRVDDTLKHVAEVVERSLVIETDPSTETPHVNLGASFRHIRDVREDDHIDLEWFAPTGDRLWSTFSEPPQLPLGSLLRHGQTVHLTPDHWLRQITRPIEQEQQLLGYLRVSHPWFEVAKPIRQLLLELSLVVSLMVLGIGGIGWLLSGLAMQPVKDAYQRLKQFTADASHELRNPIAMIQTNVQAALSAPEAQMQAAQLQVMERLAQRLGRLVNDLLFLTRLDGGIDSGIVEPAREMIPLDALLVDVVEEQRLRAEGHQVDLTLMIATPTQAEAETDTGAAENLETDFSVWGDWNQLARLMTNVISNAVDYTRVKASGAKYVVVTLQPVDKQQLQITIQDTGIGITAAALPYVFTRFYRAPVPADCAAATETLGTGLGLAIAKAIVEQHHGQISAQSVVDQGTTVTIQLPCFAE